MTQTLTSMCSRRKNRSAKKTDVVDINMEEGRLSGVEVKVNVVQKTVDSNISLIFRDWLLSFVPIVVEGGTV